MTVEPSLWLQIGTDPTPWVLENTVFGLLAAELGGATGPVVLPVVSPLRGQLVLSPRNVETVSLLGTPSVGGPHPVGDPPIEGHGPHPVGHSLAGPVVYLPSVTSANPGWSVNVLEPDTDLAAVERDIIGAMNRGTPVTLSVVERVVLDAADVIDAIGRGSDLTPRISARSGGGVLVLNGATLAFAVLARVAT